MSINQQVTFAPNFANVFGLSTGTRADAVKAVWAYAAKNNLKATKVLPTKAGTDRNTAVITTDSNLKSLFGAVEYLAVGDIAKGISKNIVQ